MKETDKTKGLSNKILTAEEQSNLTPDTVISILKQGNKEFTENALTIRNNTERMREAALGQYPKAVIVSCIDSRVPVEDIFHRGIGDLFVVRIAGNFVNGDILESLKFACKVSGPKLVVISGHKHYEFIKYNKKNKIITIKLKQYFIYICYIYAIVYFSLII